MRDKALYYYKQGYNCSQCILKAAEQYYHIYIPEDSMDMCSGISNGFGVGGTCSVLIAGVMIFGALFDKVTVKRLRLELLSQCNERFGGLNCAVISKQRKCNFTCEEIIGELAEMIEKIIAQNK